MIIKEIDKKPKWKFTFSFIVDSLLNLRKKLYHRGSSEFEELLSGYGFVVVTVPIHRALPFSNIIYGGGGMSKIVFCKPPLPLEKLYGKLSKGGNEMPPLGLCYLAGVTRKNSFKTSIVDVLPLGLNFKETANEIIKQKPKYVGITSLTISISDSAKLALIKVRFFIRNKIKFKND